MPVPPEVAAASCDALAAGETLPGVLDEANGELSPISFNPLVAILIVPAQGYEPCPTCTVSFAAALLIAAKRRQVMA